MRRRRRRRRSGWCAEVALRCVEGEAVPREASRVVVGYASRWIGSQQPCFVDEGLRRQEISI